MPGLQAVPEPAAPRPQPQPELRHKAEAEIDRLRALLGETLSALEELRRLLD